MGEGRTRDQARVNRRQEEQIRRQEEQEIKRESIGGKKNKYGGKKNKRSSERHSIRGRKGKGEFNRREIWGKEEQEIKQEVNMDPRGKKNKKPII